MAHLRSKRKRQITLRSLGGVIFSVILVFIFAAILVNVGDVARGITAKNLLEKSALKQKLNNFFTKINLESEIFSIDTTWVLNSTKTLITPNQDVIFVEEANTEIAREIGLSGRNKLKVYQAGDILTTEGMLFTFEKAGTHNFWMKDMNFDLDIIWLDQDMKIVAIEKDAKASSYNSNSPSLSRIYSDGQSSVKYVLEINSNLSDKLGLSIGSQLKFQ